MGIACGSVLAQSESDPLEPVNRVVFKFNDTVDRWFLKPVSKTYRAVLPDYFEETIARFFGNLGDVGNAANSLLQGKIDQAANDTARVLINTTIGVGGLFDVADPWGFKKNDSETFGQTLGVWGVPDGPYLVLPLLGPSTLRDTVGRVGDYYTDPINWLEDEEAQLAFNVVEIVSIRAELLDAERIISGDRYNFIRDIYLQRQAYLLNDGAVEDDFGDDLDFLD
jgi:phospholipid-binding lipoprotein MlaA